MKISKKILFSIISTLLIVTALFGYVTYASNDIPEGSSPASIQKFNEFIATLPEGQAQAILDDEELVRSMKMDYYWEESAVNSTSVRSLTSILPTEEYPANSYFTINGSACTCHTNPPRCTYSLPNNPTYHDRCYNATAGTYGNCKRYANTVSIQCMAFADYTYCQYTGHDKGNSYKVDVGDYSNVTSDAVRAAMMKNTLKALPNGSNVRFVGKPGFSNHSIIVVQPDTASSNFDKGIYLYDANRIGKCKVGFEFKTWSDLASIYKSISLAWTA